MPNQNGWTLPSGCTIAPFSGYKKLIVWVIGTGSPVAEATGTEWLLAHCDDGVV